MITSYVTIEGRPEFERNKTGFGYMVMDIAKTVGQLEQVEVLATDSRGEGFRHDGVKFIKRSILSFLKNSFFCLPIKTIFNLWSKYHMKRGSFIRLIYYWLMTGYLQKVIKEGQYDVIHIHGCDFATELWMKVCRKCGQHFIVTLHGLNSFSDTVSLESAGKRYERDFLKRVVEGEFPITVISTGIKRLIEKTYSVGDCNNINVVCNSFSFVDEEQQEVPVRDKYNIPKDAKVLLYVGNISENKNQRQMVDAYSLLPEDMRNKTWVLFCGRPSIDGSFENYVKINNFAEKLVLCGSVNKSEMENFYKASNGVALLSFAEGFGLSLIEGMHFGVPGVMFSDMDAFEDIYDETCMVPIYNRENASVAMAINELLSRTWKKDEIVEASTKFESRQMARNYINIYQSLMA